MTDLPQGRWAAMDITARGQIAITEADFDAVGEIPAEPEQITLSPKKSRRGLDVLIYRNESTAGLTT